MKQFSKQLSWMLAFVLILTSIVSTGIPVYAEETDTINIDTNTNQVIVSGTKLEFYGFGSARINYYESADSNTVLYEDTYAEKIGSDAIAVKPYAWHVSFEKEIQGDNSYTMNPSTYYFKAYPDTSLENVPLNTKMTLPEGTTLTTTVQAATGQAFNVNVSIYVGDEKLKDYNETSSFTLPSPSQLSQDIDLSTFNLPSLTKLYYNVELTEKSATSLSLKLTLVPTVEVTFNEYPGTPNLSEIQKYATPKATIDSTKLPQVSLDGIDFYGWKITGSNDYAYKTDGSPVKASVNNACELKAMYKEPNPTFKLDIANQKIINLLPSRTYEYPRYSWSTYYISQVDANDNGEIEYSNSSQFNGQFRLQARDDCFVNSDFVSLKHNTPNKPLTENAVTTAEVTNTDEFANCEFAIRATNDYSDLSWGTSSSFSGLTPDTQYKIYVRHIADENGFESDEAESVAFKTLVAKSVSNDAPNGVTIEDIPSQTYTNSALMPLLVIKDNGKTLIQGTDYTVDYTDNINVGTATAIVTFMNSYSGNMTKNFEIVYLHLVSFDGNEGTGTMSNVKVIDGQQYTLPACTFTAPANKEFKAWNVGGTEYAVGAYFTITADTTITAVWKDLEKVKAPIISPNGGSFSGSQTVTLTTETADAIIHYTTDGTIPTTESTVYSQPFAISSSVTVKAIAVKGGMINSEIASSSFTKQSSSSGGSSTPTYTTPTLTVIFNTDGGSTIDSKSIKQGSSIGEIPSPTKDGFVFDGWYSDKELTKAYSTNTKITASTTLYAKWTKVEPKLDDNSKDDNPNNDNSKNELVLTIGIKDAKAFGSDKTMDAAPIIKNNRTMLPARFIAESLGAEVTWNGKKREVTIKGKNGKGQDVTIILTIDSGIAYVNGKKVKLDSPAFIENGRTFTPLRFVAEELGANVLWLPQEKKVVITK